MFIFSKKGVHYTVAALVAFFTLAAIGNFQLFISKQTLNYWDAETSVFGAFVWDLILLLLFIAQHSIMATDWCKQKMSSLFCMTVSYRLTYVAATSFALMFMIFQWLSIPEAYLWFIDTQRHVLLWLFFLMFHALAWLMLALELVLVDLGEMIGVSQIVHYHTSLQPPLAEKMKLVKHIYSRMRHPGVVLLTIMLWIHPIMTLDRLLLACTLTSYMIGRHSFEETQYRFAEHYFKVKVTRPKSHFVTSYQLYQEDKF
uniref:Nuclear envelope membrane protein n=1 Tax=Biomphalaria glabrata TaxID=6526 RepID=A0A2C9KI38_BIOGL